MLSSALARASNFQVEALKITVIIMMMIGNFKLNFKVTVTVETQLNRTVPTVTGTVTVTDARAGRRAAAAAS